MSDRLRRYEARTTTPLMALGLAFLVVYGTPIVWRDLPAAMLHMLEILSVVIWLIFAADLVARAKLSQRWFKYLLAHPIDVVVVALPALRPLRVLRVFAAAQVLVTKSGQLSLLRTTQAIATASSLLVLIGAVTASVASWFIDRTRAGTGPMADPADTPTAQLDNRLAALESRLDEIHDLLLGRARSS